eukprot:SAG22_NODE_385_length_11304_cov_21.304775_10_plen_166_part_00
MTSTPCVCACSTSLGSDHSIFKKIFMMFARGRPRAKPARIVYHSQIQYLFLKFVQLCTHCTHRLQLKCQLTTICQHMDDWCQNSPYTNQVNHHNLLALPPTSVEPIPMPLGSKVSLGPKSAWVTPHKKSNAKKKNFSTGTQSSPRSCIIMPDVVTRARALLAAGL